MISEIDIKDIKNFFSIAETKIKLAEQVQTFYGKEIAPNFNSFDFWENEIDENKVSSIISFFLNPNEKHAHGDVYLKHFLEKFDLDFFQYNENDKVTVVCENSINNRRRIDIVIYKNNFEQAIAIENKIHVWTKDQDKQISDYLKFLAKKTENNYCLIYLCPQDKTVSAESIGAEKKEQYINENKLKILSYEEHMIDCINDFANLTQNYRVRSFLKDFEKFLKRMYMGEQNINSQQVAIDLISENVNNLEIAFLISNSLTEIKRQLHLKFEEQIKEIGKEFDLEVDGLHLRPKKWTKNRICFSFQAGGILYGLTRSELDNNKPRFPEIETAIDNAIGEKFNVSEWWSMWQYFYRNIESNEQFWIDIKSGEAKKRAKEFVKLICDNFNNEKY